MNTAIPHEKANLLYVDDERANLTAFRVLLRDQYNVLTAENAEDAYRLLRENDIPLVVSDQRMPGMTGTELLAKVANDFPDCARMILTGYSDIEAVIEGVNRSQIYYYFKKPWNEAEVRLTLENALEYVMTRRRLTESELLFRSTFEKAGVGIAHLDLNGSIMRANQRLADFVGVPESQLIGQPVTSWFSEINSEAITGITDSMSAMTVRETSYSTPKTSKWCRLAVTVSRNRKGDLDYLILIVEDLTERKQVEADLARIVADWQNTFNSVNDVIWTLDSNERILRCNKSCEALFGLTPGRMRIEAMPRSCPRLPLPHRFLSSETDEADP